MRMVRLGPADWEQFRNLRLAALADAPSAFGSSYADWIGAPADRWRSRLVTVPLNLIAIDREVPVGMVSGTNADESWCELISLWVDPEYRGIGLAQELIDAVINWAASLGKRVFLMVRSANAPALAAYRKAGFTNVGKPDAESHEIRMELPAG